MSNINKIGKITYKYKCVLTSSLWPCPSWGGKVKVHTQCIVGFAVSLEFTSQTEDQLDIEFARFTHPGLFH